MSLGSELARFWLAQDCALCGAPSGPDALCARCEGALEPLPESCPRCAMPSPARAVCGACLAHPPHFDATFAAWRYDYPADRLLLSLKFHRRLALAPLLALALEKAGLASVDMIVPMPLDRARLAERGFNQAAEIARHLARATGTPLSLDAVARVRATRPQTDLPHAERVRNVRGAFAARAPLEKITVAVVDDVMTTGATLNEVAKTLKRAGAARVVNWVVARTLPK